MLRQVFNLLSKVKIREEKETYLRILVWPKEALLPVVPASQKHENSILAAGESIAADTCQTKTLWLQVLTSSASSLGYNLQSILKIQKSR